MKALNRIRGSSKARTAAVALTGFWIGGGLFAEAQTNSSEATNPVSQAGLYQWLNGQNQLQQKWVWYRVGNSNTTGTPAATADAAPVTTNSATVTTNSQASDETKPTEFKPLQPGEYNNWLNLGVQNTWI